jgi:hypothetical protein
MDADETSDCFKVTPVVRTFTLVWLLELFAVLQKMETKSKPLPLPSSDEAVSKTMQHGLEKIVAQAGIGLVVGGMAGLVLSRGGASSARKVMAGLGAGAGAGSAWTRCSIDLEELLSSK